MVNNLVISRDNNSNIVFEVNEAGTLTNVGQIAGSSGAWTIGQSGSVQTHTVNGSTFKLASTGASGTTGSITISGGTGGGDSRLTLQRNAVSKWVLNAADDGPGGTDGFGFFLSPATVYVGGISTVGAWTIGPGTPSATLYHKISGVVLDTSDGTIAGASASFGSTGTLVLGANYLRPTGSGIAPSSTTNGYSRLNILPTTTGTNTAFDFAVNITNTGNNGGSVNGSEYDVGTCSAVGTWTLGNGSNTTIAHVAQNNATTTATGGSAAGNIVCTLTLSNQHYTQGTDTSGDVRLGFAYGGQSASTAAAYIAGRRQSSNTVGVVVHTENGNNTSAVGAILNANSTSWSSESDRRSKKNIQALNLGLDTVMNMSPVRYDYNWDTTDNSGRLGFVAQDLYPVVPEATWQPNDETTQTWNVSLETLVPVLVKALQELKAQNDALKARVDGYGIPS